MQAVIPAAGLATRMLPATKVMPKEMLPIIDKPAIQFIVEEAVASGIDDILIITGRNKRIIEDHFDRTVELELQLTKKGMLSKLEEMRQISDCADIHFIRQKEPLGLGHAIYRARKHITGPFSVLLGDNIFYSERPAIGQLIDSHKVYGHNNILAVKPVSKCDLDKYGIVRPSSRTDFHLFPIKQIIEKPSLEEAPSNMGCIGRYVLNDTIFDALERIPLGYGGEFQLTDAIGELIKTEPVYAQKVIGTRFDVGNTEEYVKAIMFESKRRGFL